MMDERSVLGKLRGYCVGASYAFLWYGSILLGFFFLYAPVFPLIFINAKLFRKLTDTFYSSWEAFNVSLLQGVYGVKVVLTGDNVPHPENALIIINHPTRTDWNFLWAGLHHLAPSHNAKIILKEEVKKIPGLGWIMSMSRFIYLKRKWSEDKIIIDNMLDYFADIRDEDPKQLVLFPEGTNMSTKNKARSDEFAKKNNKQEYSHVLHPRTTGFVHLAKGMIEREMLDAVYDVTMAYPDTKPETEMSLLQGFMPSQINIHLVRHPVQRLPNTYIGLEKWLEETWGHKETALDQFYQNPPSFNFPCLTPQQLLPRPMTLLQPLCLCSCSLLFLYLLTLVVTSIPAITWVMLVWGATWCLENKLGGVQECEMRWRKKSETVVNDQDEFEHLKDD